MDALFVKSKLQQEILFKLAPLLDEFKKREPLLDHKGAYPSENIEELKRIGYTGLTVPKTYGGEEISLTDFILFQEAVATGSGPTALSIGWHLGIMMDIHKQSLWKDEALFEWFCQEALAGKLVNRAASEVATGSPTRGGKPQTTAIEVAGGYALNGEKVFTTLAPALDYFLVTASLADEVAEFLVPRELTGVSIEPWWDSVSMRGTASEKLVLEQVEVPKKFLVNIVNKPKQANNGWLLHIPACYLGMAQAAATEATQFAKNYQPNSLNAPISTLPAIRQQIGEMELELTQARHFLYSICEKYDEGLDVSAELGAVKHTVTNMALSVVDKAMRIYGARSLSEANPMWRYYLNIRAGLHNPPMDDAVISSLAARALERV